MSSVFFWAKFSKPLRPQIQIFFSIQSKVFSLYEERVSLPDDLKIKKKNSLPLKNSSRQTIFSPIWSFYFDVIHEYDSPSFRYPPLVARSSRPRSRVLETSRGARRRVNRKTSEPPSTTYAIDFAFSFALLNVRGFEAARLTFAQPHPSAHPLFPSAAARTNPLSNVFRRSLAPSTSIFFFSLLSSCHDRPLLLSLSLLPNDFPREFCSFTKSRRRGEGILPQCFILSTKISPSNLRFSRSRVQISDNLDLNLYRFSLSLSGKSHSFSMVDHQFFRFPISAAISPASAVMWKMPLVADVYSATENTRINRGIVVKHVTIVGIPFDGESRLPREPIRPLDFESTPANPEIFRGHEQ